MYELEGRKGEERGMGKRKGVRPAAFFDFCAFAAAAGLRPAACCRSRCCVSVDLMEQRLQSYKWDCVCHYCPFLGVLKGAVVSLEKRRKKVAYGCTWMASLVETPSAVPLSGKI